MSDSNANTASRHATDDLRSMAQDVKAAAQEKVGAAAQKIQQVGSDVKHAVQDRFEDLQNLAAGYYDQGLAKARPQPQFGKPRPSSADDLFDRGGKPRICSGLPIDASVDRGAPSAYNGANRRSSACPGQRAGFRSVALFARRFGKGKS